MKQMTLITAVKTHCALPGESLSDFSKQYKELTDDDKDWFRREFRALEIEIVEKHVLEGEK